MVFVALPPFVSFCPFVFSNTSQHCHPFVYGPCIPATPAVPPLLDACAVFACHHSLAFLHPGCLPYPRRCRFLLLFFTRHAHRFIIFDTSLTSLTKQPHDHGFTRILCSKCSPRLPLPLHYHTPPLPLAQPLAGRTLRSLVSAALLSSLPGTPMHCCPRHPLSCNI